MRRVLRICTQVSVTSLEYYSVTSQTTGIKVMIKYNYKVFFSNAAQSINYFITINALSIESVQSKRFLFPNMQYVCDVGESSVSYLLVQIVLGTQLGF